MARAKDNVEPIERIARSMDLLLRLKLGEVKGDRSQRDMIRFLGSHGATAGEIASLLGVSSTTVHPELSKARAQSATRGKAQPRSRKRKG